MLASQLQRRVNDPLDFNLCLLLSRLSAGVQQMPVMLGADKTGDSSGQPLVLNPTHGAQWS